MTLRGVDVKANERENPTAVGLSLLSPSIMTQVLQAPAINKIQIRWPTPGQVLSHMALFAAVTTLAALAFRRYVTWPDVDESLMPKEKLTSWSTGPFDCFQDMNSCLWTCFCPGVRWAGTMNMVGLLTFWPAFLLFLFFELVAMIPLGGCCCLGWVAVLTYYRNKLRVAFGMAGSNEPQTICGDCVFVTCCTCCAIAQEARHVEHAAIVNHEATMAQRPLLAPQQEATPA
eukprot:CAMPEP_0114680290 /NCGR_PEP_ID=MMETSP0191-20121206/53941_1 /TAXON_ID=126664 /ORGANISM="Sorites sp." /LENGTH=229 /DNA_ID=CAMNT_0001956847 /DNA_START=121 /DNA_END=810 /DNA_ORIENTATION=-